MKRISSKHGSAFVFVLCILVAAVALTGTVLAKYITSNKAQELASARDFRFESNYLTEAGGTYPVYGDSVDITLMNTDGLTTAADDVTYSITITAGSGTLDRNSGTIAKGGNNTNTHTLTVATPETVTVTATSTSPYAKTITATFVFAAQEASYTVTNHERYVQIDIYTADAVSGITVNGTSGLTPDATNPDFSGSNIGPLNADSHYTFVYFKNAAKDFTSVSNGALTDTITLS